MKNVVVARGGGSTSIQSGLGQLVRQGPLPGTQRRRWKFWVPQPGWNAWHMMVSSGKHRWTSQVHMQRRQGNRTRRAPFGPMRFCRTKWKPHRKRTLSAGSMPQQAGEGAPCNDERKLGQRAAKATDHAYRNGTENPRTTLPISSGGNHWANMYRQIHLEKYPCMTSQGKLTISATPWTKQFRDDITLLREFDEGDEFARELNGNLWKVFFDAFGRLVRTGFQRDPSKMLEQNLATARNMPRTRRGLLEKETHNTDQCRCWTKEGEKCTEHCETHTHGLKLCVTTVTISNVCPMCKTFFRVW